MVGPRIEWEEHIGQIAGFGVPTINLDNLTVRRIFDAYREPDKTKKAALEAELDAACALREVSVKMAGVWDTVGSLRIPGIFFNVLNQRKYGFLDTALLPCVHSGPIRMEAFVRTMLRLNSCGFPEFTPDVGGGYQECELSDVTLSWMMHKARENGLSFSSEAEQQYLSPCPQNALGMAHDEWKIVPWRIPEHRNVPAAAVMSNSVQIRLSEQRDYRPESINLNVDRIKLSGYCIARVLPYRTP